MLNRVSSSEAKEDTDDRLDLAAVPVGEWTSAVADDRVALGVVPLFPTLALTWHCEFELGVLGLKAEFALYAEAGTSGGPIEP
jgi:hypothetical protein